MRRIFAAGIIVSVVLLSGCASVDEYLGNIFLDKAGITSQEDYLRYKHYEQANELDEAGYYMESAAQMQTFQQQESKGKIHITFGNNRYIEVLYYTDADMTTPLVTNECYLNPGDTLYAKVNRYKNSNSNLYRLAEYRIREYDADGNIQNEYTQKVSDDVLEYQIPADFAGTELSVLPVGEYVDRELSMHVYYVDNNGQERSLGNAGNWFIEDTMIQGDTTKISPVKSYALKFVYDTQNYFFVSSQPECFTKDPNDAGFVEFWEAEPTDADTTYRVELHPYLKLSLQCNQQAQIRVGAEEVQTIKKNDVFQVNDLRYGDSIIIETTGECTIIDGDYQHIRAVKDPISNGYRYTLYATQEVESNVADVLTLTIDVNRVFDVALNTNGKYGVCTYKLDGDDVSGEVQLKEGQKLTLTYEITEQNYRFVEKSQGVTGFFHDLINRNQRTVKIPITADLDGVTINPDDWFEIVQKEA